MAKMLIIETKKKLSDQFWENHPYSLEYKFWANHNVSKYNLLATNWNMNQNLNTFGSWVLMLWSEIGQKPDIKENQVSGGH